MSRLFVYFQIATVIFCLTDAPAMARGEYNGPDAGVLVISLGSIGTQVQDYTIWWKTRGQRPGLFPYTISYDPYSILFDHKPDYSGKEIGQVHILHLKPGDYEFYRAAIFATVGIQNFTFDLPEFSLPFTIKPGETTYIGNLAGVADWQGARFRGGYYVLSDQHERDVGIARQKDPQLPAITVAVPDVANMSDKLIFGAVLPSSNLDSP